jgi:tyrosine-specific transport protein
MATSFLSVSLSLSDFLADGFGVVKKGWGNVLVFSFTFLPPLAIVLFYPDAFIRALQYAGLSVIVLMVFLPPLMAWIGRNDKDLPRGDFQVRGGKFLLGMIIIISIILIYFSLAEHMQWLWTKINLGT